MTQRIAALLILLGVLLVAAIPVVADTHTPNQVGYWCEMGEKFDPVSTPFLVPLPPEGYEIGLVIVKAGSEQSTETPHAEFYNVEPGDSLVHPSGKEISHVIVCYEPEGTTTTTEQTTTTTEPVITTTTQPVVITNIPTWGAGCVDEVWLVRFENGGEANDPVTVDFIYDSGGVFDEPVAGGGEFSQVVPTGEAYAGSAFDAEFQVVADTAGTAEDCTEQTTTTTEPPVTTTTAPPTTTTTPPTDSTLPVTGPEDYAAPLGIGGALALLSGGGLLALTRLRRE